MYKPCKLTYRESLIWMILLIPAAAVAQTTSHPIDLVRTRIDENRRTTLIGNTRPEATAANSRGKVADDFPLNDMLLQLRRSDEQEAALNRYLDELSDPASPNFQNWLSPKQFASQFGVSQNDLDTVTAWLTAKGFTVQGASAGGLTIDFSGTAAQVRTAFHTDIHRLSVNGVSHIANMQDPEIPLALAPLVAGIVSLHDFHPKAHLVQKSPQYTFNGGANHALVPGDIQAIYNINPLLAAGFSGTGQSIMVLEDTYLYSTGDWTVFRKTFGLARAYPHGSLSQVSPTGATKCTNPGFQGDPTDPGYGDDSEAAIDVEWATATAPNAAIILAACEDSTTTFGGLIALQNTLNGPPDKLPSVVSISYGESEASNGTAANLAYLIAYEQAAAEGVSIFVSSGDEGAAISDGGNPSTHGITVSGFASTPFNVAVGGLDFSYTANLLPASDFWNDNNTATYGSARGYIPEIPWNDSCAGGVVAAFVLGPSATGLDFCNISAVASPTGQLNGLLNAIGGSGGPSGCAIGTPSARGKVSGSCLGYAKPSWQRGLFGNPHDGVRDLPDVSLFASNGFWDAYYVACWSNTDPNNTGAPCTGAPSSWAGFGGTSISSPIMAAIQALVNEKTGRRWGNPNHVYYRLAKAEFGANGSAACDSSTIPLTGSPCIFYDVTQGDNVGVCRATKAGVLTNCYKPANDAYGILSTSNFRYLPAYTSNTGWDFTSGIGSVNAYNLVMGWPTPATPASRPSDSGENH